MLHYVMSFLDPKYIKRFSDDEKFAATAARKMLEVIGDTRDFRFVRCDYHTKIIRIRDGGVKQFPNEINLHKVCLDRLRGYDEEMLVRVFLLELIKEGLRYEYGYGPNDVRGPLHEVNGLTITERLRRDFAEMHKKYFDENDILVFTIKYGHLLETYIQDSFRSF